MIPYFTDPAGITVYHGRAEDVLSTLETGSVDLVLTDPPYGIGIADWDAAVPLWCGDEVRRALKDGGSCYWFGLPPMVYDAYKTLGLTFMREVYWWFDTGYPHPSNYRLATETILFLAKGDAPAYFDDSHIRESYQAKPGGGRIHNPRGKSAGNVIYCPRPAPGHASENEHITAKPLRLIERLVQTSCPVDGLILDPFAGSGTTAAAAKLLGRRCIVIEQDERYADLIVSRLAQSVLPLEVTS